MVVFLVMVGCSHHDPKDQCLFTIEVESYKDLDECRLSDGMRQSFEGHGHSLSEGATVEVREAQQQWLIHDKEMKKEYLIVKEENALKVYEDRLNFENLKDSREGLDYERDPAPIFSDLDDLLKRWFAAQAQEQYGVCSAIGNQMRQMSCAYFSKLVEALAGDNRFERLVASASLGFSNDIRAIPYLLEVMGSEDALVRYYAAFSMGQINFSQFTPEVTQKVMDALITSLRQEEDDDVRGMVAFTIAQVVERDRDWGRLPHLLAAIGDRSDKVRNHVVLALGKIGHPEGAKAIIAATLDDANPGVRYSSVRALGQIGSEDVEITLPLVRKLKDSSPIVAGAAYHVLKHITGEDFGPDPAKWEEWAGGENLPDK